MKEKYDVVIIGGGISGLTCAAWLSRKGLEVLLIEKNDRVGGLCSTFKKGEFLFHPCASVIAGCSDGFLPKLFSELKLKDIDFIPLPSVFKYVIPGYTVTEDRDTGSYVNRLSELFPKEQASIKSFFEEMQHIYSDLEKVILADDRINYGKVKKSPITKYTGKTLIQVIRKIFNFKDEKLISLLCGLPASLMCLPPEEVSFLSYAFFVMQWHNGGCFIVKGGIQNLADALKGSIEEHGGEVLLSSTVKKLLIKDKKVYAVRLENGEEIQANYFVSAINLYHLYLNLLGITNSDMDTVKKLRDATLPYSIFGVCVGVDAKVVADAEPAYHCYSPAYNLSEWYSTIEKNMYSIDAQVIANATLVADSSLASSGKATLTLYLPVTYQTKASWPSLKEKMADVLIKRAEKLFPGIKNAVSDYMAFTPIDYENWILSEKASLTGFAETVNHSLDRRFAHKTIYDNLFTCGQWTQPGMGINSAIYSGLTAAKIILQKEGIDPLRELGY